ncbi:MAG TPA: ABC transporter permease [Gemmatimonadaceae bacterium]|nr:ABC transporter permease [Gemmatimonadaceae bacterium]
MLSLSALPVFLLRRSARAAALVLVVSSAALTTVHLAPGDAFTGFDMDPTVARAERARLGLDRPYAELYATWLRRALVLDLGESTRFKRPVSMLLAERVPSTLLLGASALLVAVIVGIPLGVAGGARPDRWWAHGVRAISMLLISVPSLITSLVLLLIAARTGWLPAGGLQIPQDATVLSQIGITGASLLLPALALALPIAATIERLQARAVADALREPCVQAVLARGISRRRALWNHAFRLSLPPVLAVLGIVVGSVLSGSFVVEIVMSWPGMGDLMYEALLGRDVFLAAGCAAAASVLLAGGVLASDLALASLDPKIREAD